MKRTLYVTKLDKERLDDLLEAAHEFGGRADLSDLERELKRSKIVDSKSVPHSVVTMNSRVRLRDMGSGDEMEYTLVFPKDANIEEGRISVISPVGTAILGYSVGDEIEWRVPAGVRKLKIEEILYQPEASGHYDV